MVAYDTGTDGGMKWIIKVMVAYDTGTDGRIMWTSNVLLTYNTGTDRWWNNWIRVMRL